MIGISKNKLRPKLLELRLCHCFYRSRCPYGHEDWSVNLTVIGDELSQACFCLRVFREDFKLQICSLSYRYVEFILLTGDRSEATLRRDDTTPGVILKDSVPGVLPNHSVHMPWGNGYEIGTLSEDGLGLECPLAGGLSAENLQGWGPKPEELGCKDALDDEKFRQVGPLPPVCQGT